jgi:uncharacterized protein (TIGR00725 family)
MEDLINMSLVGQRSEMGLSPQSLFRPTMPSDIIGVIGASRADGELLRLAEELGQEIASRGVAVVCGGMTGVMEAVCKGARAKGGLTIGIIPSDDKNDANQYVQIPIVTGMGVGRNVVLVKTADVLIAVGGEYGTLSEIAHALNIGKKVISLRSWQLERATEKPIPNLIGAGSPREAVDRALDAIAESHSLSMA